MISIVKGTEAHAPLLSELAKFTFLESHGHSAKETDIQAYVREKYTEAILKKELQDPENIYHILYNDDVATGFSKIVLNCPTENAGSNNIAKLERIYFLKEYYGSGFGQQLFDFIIRLAKESNQSGIWLYVWKENERAVKFYKRNGFVVTGSHNFKISETHSNPNYRMLLSFPSVKNS